MTQHSLVAFVSTVLAMFALTAVSYSQINPPARNAALAPAGAYTQAPGTAYSSGAKDLGVNYSDLPLSFEMNRGQTGAQARFISRPKGYALYLTDSEAVFRFPGNSHSVSMKLSGANRTVRASGSGPLPGIVNYLLGGDSSKWLTKVPTYSKVEYSGVYPGIDLTFYGKQSQLEYDFNVAPGADPDLIRLQFSHVKTLRMNRRGDLLVLTRRGRLVLHKPTVYQRSENERVAVDGQFRLLAGNAVGFRLGAYDRSKEVVIDPTLSYATYLGGPSAGLGSPLGGIAVDQAGNAYVTGEDIFPDFPVTPGAFQTGVSFGKVAFTAFVTKLNASGTALVYSTYLGGSGGDSGWAIAVDAAGHAYVGGTTSSTDFPTTTGAFQEKAPFVGVAQTTGSGFIAELSADGTSLVYSTYLGPFLAGGLQGIAIDAAGEVFATGAANSTAFPTTAGAFQTTFPGGCGVFVTKLNASGAALVYSTFIDGSGPAPGDDASSGIAVDTAGSAYITGTTFSKDFPVTSGAYQTSPSSSFVTKLSADGKSLVYSTFLGGKSGGVTASAITIDGGGNAYVVGGAGGSDFPVTTGAFQTQPKGDTFLTKLNPTGTGLVYSTYLGASGYATNVAVDGSGNAYVTGVAQNGGLLVTSDAFQKSTNTGAYLFEMNPMGTAPVYATYLGNNFNSGFSKSDSSFVAGPVIALDSSESVYLAGCCGTVPVTSGAFQTQPRGSNPQNPNGFIAKFSASANAIPIVASVANGASGQEGIVPGAWATIYGSNLAPVTDTWSKFIVNGKLPTVLDGVSVAVGGQPAYVDFISPSQINFVVPNVGSGSQAVIVTQPSGSSVPFTTTSSTYGPAFFLFPGNQVVATHLDYTLAVKPGTFTGLNTVPAKPGEVIILWGTGLGPTDPAAPEGMEVPSNQTYNTATLPSVNISSLPATVYGAALAPGFAGLYQVAVKVPESLADGDWPVVSALGGVSSEAGVILAVQQ